MTRFLMVSLLATCVGWVPSQAQQSATPELAIIQVMVSFDPPTPTFTPSNTPTFTSSPTHSFTQTPSETPTPTFSLTPTVTPSATDTATSTHTPTPTSPVVISNPLYGPNDLLTFLEDVRFSGSIEFERLWESATEFWMTDQTPSPSPTPTETETPLPSDSLAPSIKGKNE